MAYLESKATKERVRAKISKKVRLGEKEFESISAAARSLKRTPAYIAKIIKDKKTLPDGTPVTLVKI